MFPNLEAEMARGKITQSSIALSLGITPTTFSFKLNGKAPISLKECVKIVIYGPEGIGKSTFASQFPDPVFIDTEGSTNSMDVARLPKPTSWQMLLEEIQYVKSHPNVCRTLVID